MHNPILFKSEECFYVYGMAYLKTTLAHKEVADRVAAHLIPGGGVHKWEFDRRHEEKTLTLKNVLGFDLKIMEDPYYEGCFVYLQMSKEFQKLLWDRYGDADAPWARISDFVFWSLRGIPDMEVIHDRDIS